MSPRERKGCKETGQNLSIYPQALKEREREREGAKKRATLILHVTVFTSTFPPAHLLTVSVVSLRSLIYILKD